MKLTLEKIAKECDLNISLFELKGLIKGLALHLIIELAEKRKLEEKIRGLETQITQASADVAQLQNEISSLREENT